MASMALVSMPQMSRRCCAIDVDRLAGPVVYSVGSLAAAHRVLCLPRDSSCKPTVAWAMLEPVAAADGPVDDRHDFASDRDQARQRADRRPGVPARLLHLAGDAIGRCRTTSGSRAAMPPLEKLDDEKVLVWPDLVYTELICMVALTAFLMLWAIGSAGAAGRAGQRVKTPNPSKAPWYFLGLQEMLVYYDPWMAGVVLPSMIIVGLMAIPVHRFQQEGERLLHDRRAQVRLPDVSVRLSRAVDHADRAGHVPPRPELELLRVLRNWDAHKVEALNNVDLSEYFWIDLLADAATRGAGRRGDCWSRSATSCCASRPASCWSGRLLHRVAAALMVAIPIFRKLFMQDGIHAVHGDGEPAADHGACCRIKMVLRWSFNLKYIVAIPEYLLNF